jgi:hypothetical protein
MAKILQLKKRKRSDIVRVPTALIIDWLGRSEEDAKDIMYTFFEPFEDADVYVHDKVYLENIINWVPVDEQSGRPKGLPLSEQVRWIKLAEKVDAVDEDQDGEIELTSKDMKAIFDRISSKEYKVGALTKPFIAFLMNYQETTGDWFEELEPEAESKTDLETDVTLSSNDGKREPVKEVADA